MITRSTTPPSASRFGVLALLLACPPLVVAAALTQRQVFPMLVLVLLLSASLLPQLLARRAAAWLGWSLGVAALAWLAAAGYVDLLLKGLPILINALLAWWFGRTLSTAEPLVARFVVAIEGRERLAQPGVARYARQVTWFWTLLMAAQAVLLAALLLFAAHTGLLARLGIASPLPLSDRWAAAWLHVGGYALIAAAFAFEYAWRRWRLRHLSHPGLHTVLLQLALHWPQLLRGNGVAVP